MNNTTVVITIDGLIVIAIIITIAIIAKMMYDYLEDHSTGFTTFFGIIGWIISLVYFITSLLN